MKQIISIRADDLGSNLYVAVTFETIIILCAHLGMATTPQGLKYKVIELPYHGNTVSMLIALPSEEDTPLSHIIPHISTATVQSWFKQMHMRKVRLLIPK